jgi:DNA-binding response OmpR family regulator
MLTDEQPSLILCDAGWWQPVLAESRELFHCTPLIVFTPLADEELWLDVIEAGGHDVLLAPFYERELVHTVNTALTPVPAPKAQSAGG